MCLAFTLGNNKKGLILAMYKFYLVFGACFLSSFSLQAVTLNVYEWEGYISTFKEDFEAYAKSKGKDITLSFLKGSDGKISYISNADDIFEALRSKPVDVVTPTHNYYQGENGRLIRLLKPIDISKLSHYSNVLSTLRVANFGKKEGKDYALPLLGGAYSLAYNADRVEAPISWAALADQSKKTSITSGQVEANIYIAALLAGSKPEDVYRIDKINVEETAKHLNEIFSNKTVFLAGMADPYEMKNLDYVTSYWFGVAAANKAGQNWKFAKPKEGQTLWLDNISISATVKSGSEKEEAAYMLLDYMISPEVQKKILDVFGSVIVNSKVKEMVSEEVATQYSVGDSSFFKEEYFWQPLDKRTANGYKNLWNKASAK